MRCYRRLLNNTYKDQFTKEEDSRKTQAAIAEYDELLPPEEAETYFVWPRLKVFWSSKKWSHRAHKRKEETDRRRCLTAILMTGQEWTENRTRWKGIVAKSSMVP